MQYTTLGKTGLKVSVAGLGCGGNSRIGLGTGLSSAQSVALVREALDLGVNFLDTAAAYETEDIVGEAIKQVVFRAIYAVQNAGLQLDAMRLGDPVFLDDEEARLASETDDRVVDKPWVLWRAEVLGEK